MAIRARRTLPLILAAVLVGAVAIGAAYRRDLRAAHARLADGVAVVETRHGAVAYQAGGAGAPVLVVHGAGGGHDQGRLLAGAFLGDGHRFIAPSRFGYPGSAMPPDPSTAAQADAFADLLDALGIARVSLLAMSGGAPPALQFAIRHPDRVAALILISSAPYAPLGADEQDPPVPTWLYEALFASDLPLWAVLRLSPRALAPIFDAREDLIAGASAREAAFLDATIAAFLPVTARRAGLANEGAAIDPAAPIAPAAIAAPTLVVHASDDRLAPVATATFTADRVAGAEALIFDKGGHLLLGHHEAVGRSVAAFLEAHAGGDGE